MGKAARVKRERELGLRKQPGTTRWTEIKPGMRLVIPKYAMVRMGASPHMIPIPPKQRFKGHNRNERIESELTRLMAPKRNNVFNVGRG